MKTHIHHPISAVIITFNEEQSIGKCIDALLPIMDEVVVVDSFSTDKTPEICRDKGVNFVQLPWEGYSKTKNHGNHIAKNELIFSIDADEIPDPKLIAELKLLQKNGLKGVYRIRRKNFYGSRWIRFGGWYPDKKIRIFNKCQASWDGDFVHEDVTFNTVIPVVDLRGHLLHYTLRDEDHHLQTIAKYANLAAEKALKSGKTYSIFWAIRSYIITFLKIYVFKLGFLEGALGLKIAKNSAKSKWLRYQYWKEKTQI